MPADQNSQHGRRPHFHRGRRGPDRRGPDRRGPQHVAEPSGRDNADVEQIMRDIRARISQQHGIELNQQQIQELAARRLEAILEPRHLKPSLLEQLRRGAGEPAGIAPAPEAAPPYTFEDTTLYESHRGLLRTIRRLLNPILKLFFNPTPLIHALNAQARVNREAAAREVERERRQAEWNALHYQILERLVTELARVSVEMQHLSMRAESLATKVDFNERRVRGLENLPVALQTRAQPARSSESIAPPPLGGESSGEAAASQEGTADPMRRRRRRRRGRRGPPSAVDQANIRSEQTTGPVDDDDAEGGEPGVDEADVAVLGTNSAPDDIAAIAPPVPAPEAPAVDSPPETAAAQAPVQPTPPRDEPVPAAPVDRATPGPEDR